MNGSAADLDAILALSRDMLATARAADWAALTALEARRRAMIEAYFTPSTAGHLANGEADAVRAILDLDRATVTLAETARDGCVNGVRDLERVRHARQAYSQNSR